MPAFNHRSDEIFQTLIRLVDEAGIKIMEIYQTEFSVQNKKDNSPVTAADQKAEKIIVDGLRKLTPDIPVVAEEEISQGAEVNISGNIFWLVDALDGTREFINKREEFTVNIALVSEETPILGVVGVPAKEDLYYGVNAGKALVRKNGVFHQIKARKPPAKGAIMIASRSHGDKKEVQKLLNTMPNAELKIAGSSLKFCLIAEGKADIYPRFGHTREWDTAAGDAILRAAGGSVRTPNGSPIIYGKEHFLNDDFIARGCD